MINTKIFSFGSKSLILKSTSEIDDKFEKNIQFLLDEFLFELNHNSKDSSAQKFNEAQTNIPIYLTKEYVDFFEYNVDFYNHFNGRFDPFKIKPPLQQDIRNAYIKDGSNESLIKLISFKLDTSHLRSSYILELLKIYLKEKSLQDYILILPDIITAVGEYTWEVNFKDSDDFATKTFDLQNSSAFLLQDIKTDSKDSTFGVKENNLLIKEAVLTGDNLSFLKLLALDLRNSPTKTTFTNAAKKEGIDILILDPMGNYGVFKGRD